MAVDRRRLSRVQRWWLAGVVAAAVVIVVGTPVADGDTGSDLLHSAEATWRNVGRLPWRIAPALVVVSLLHYLAAAVALRAAAGMRLPLGEATWVQYAAAAANRLTPAGLGGAAVNARFLQRQGLPTLQAVGTVAILGGLGAVADLLVFLGLVVAGGWVGISGGSHELTALAHKLQGPLRALGGLPGFVRVAGIALAAVAVLVLARRRRHRAASSAPSWARTRQLWTMLLLLIRAPRRLLTLLAASGATTLLLACGFAVTALASSPAPAAGFGTLLVGYLIGGAVGTAVPAPAAVGATEAALVSVLIAAQVPVASAVTTVLLFRLVTFWAPAVVGLYAVHHLRRRHEF